MKMKQRNKDYTNTGTPDFGNGGHIDCRVGKGGSKKPVKQGK